MLHQFFSKFGIFWAKHHYMPHGISWLADLKRFSAVASDLIILDIGANVGQTTQDILEAFPHATVHAFEPVKATFEQFKQRFGTISAVHCNHLAISDTCGQATIISTADSQHSHLARDSDELAQQRPNQELIQTITVDAYCANEGILHIDILKTDTEGHDLDVLKGAESSLKSGKIDWVLTEVTFDPTDKAHTMFNDVNEYLLSHGMSVYCFYDHGYTGRFRRHLFCNVLYIRNACAAGLY
jgi:FkbM family methyltransferase